MNELPATPSQTIGPFFAVMLPLVGDGEAAAGGHIRIEGRVFDGAGEPVGDAMIESWQPPGEETRDGRLVRCFSRPDGRFAFETVKPGRVPGFDERLQAPHLALSVFARGVLKRLVTRVYFADEAANGTDPLLGSIADESARASLVAACEGPGRYRFDVYLQGEKETAFFAL